MRWETIPTNVSNLIEYRLMEGEEQKVVLKYNSLQHTVRVFSNNTWRMFFITQHAGLLRNKTVFTNEYGVEVGKLSTDKWYSSHYTIELEGKKYHISFRNNPLAELVVYTKNINEPLITCGIKIKDNKAEIDFDASQNDEASSLLLGLCWYLFLPIAKENVTSMTAFA